MAHSIFSIDDIADFQEVFQYFDSAKKGFVTSQQLGTTLRALIPRPTENEIRSLVEAFSSKKSNKVNFKQYLDCLHDAIENTRKQKIHDNKPKRKRSHVTNLTPEQLSDIRDTFALFDQDGDGTISVNELQTTMSSLGQRVSKAEIKEMLEDAETSDNGSLDYPAFLSMMTRKSANKDVNTEMAEVFKFFDENGDGTITKEELKICMKRIGEDLTEDEINEMLSEADIDGDGCIEFDEFAKLMTWPKQ